MYALGGTKSETIMRRSRPHVTNKGSDCAIVMLIRHERNSVQVFFPDAMLRFVRIQSIHTDRRWVAGNNTGHLLLGS
jgi:hypothetical protein